MAAIYLEDQAFPKKRGFFAGKQVISLEEHLKKIEAALDASTDPAFVIIARQLYPTWSNHSLENVAMRLKVANGVVHRALSDARLVKDMFLELPRRTPTLKKISELMRVSQPLTFADAPVCTIDATPGFED